MVIRLSELLLGGAWDNEYEIGLQVPFSFFATFEPI